VGIQWLGPQEDDEEEGTAHLYVYVKDLGKAITGTVPYPEGYTPEVWN